MLSQPTTQAEVCPLESFEEYAREPAKFALGLEMESEFRAHDVNMSQGSQTNSLPSGGYRSGGGGVNGLQQAHAAYFSSPSPTSSSTSGSKRGKDTGSEGDVAESQLDKKTRHKLVEQNRREKTRALTAELQSIVKPGSTVAAGTSINTVLEGVLQYLQNVAQTKGANLSDLIPPKTGNPEADSLCVRLTMGEGSVPRSFAGAQWGGALETAPMGIIMASLTGEVVRCNSLFFNLFGLDKMSDTPSMFSLTAPSSVGDTMQAATNLISGQTNVVSLRKRCFRRGNVEDEFHVEMRCIRKNNAPKYMVCYVRRAGSSEDVRDVIDDGTDLYRRNYDKFVTSPKGDLGSHTLLESMHNGETIEGMFPEDDIHLDTPMGMPMPF